MRRAFFACLWFALAPAGVLPASRAWADSKHPSPEAVRAAGVHFQRARTLYEAGNYQDAITELETARALDPYAQDLVKNLGIVHEKAGHIDDALHFYRIYLDMDLDPAERARAEGIVKRLEGARVHVQPATATTTPTTTVVAPPAHGRIDALTVSSGVIALAGFGLGAGFGVAALQSRPPAGYIAGTDPGASGTYSHLQSMADSAHTLAIVSDVAFLGGIVFTAVTLGLFFGRTKKAEKPTSMQVYVSPSIAPRSGGILLGGHF